MTKQTIVILLFCFISLFIIQCKEDEDKPVPATSTTSTTSTNTDFVNVNNNGNKPLPFSFCFWDGNKFNILALETADSNRFGQAGAIFMFSAIPSEGSYKVKLDSDTTGLLPTECDIVLNTGTNSYFGNGGDVTVTQTAGKLRVTASNITVYDSREGISVKASASAGCK